MWSQNNMTNPYMFSYYIALVITIFAPYVAYATHPTQLQDFCVGVNDPKDALFVNGLFCKDPNTVTPEDFFLQGLNEQRSTNNQLGSNITLINANKLPGLNTLGISIARVDYGPYGLNPPHSHPRATELFTVIEGTFYAGFLTSNQPNGVNKLFSKVLHKGDVFVFPQGLVHFQYNLDQYNPGRAFSVLSSQNPGLIPVAKVVFGAQPSVSVDVLTKAFQLDGYLVKQLQSRFQLKL